ncbi:hypothetical protein BJX61DRAFT_539689 [Aspergillus egyptiacus]|nr:hypothetical protein BJX61DRAFT_539689 [Aspergillus egyptiacus]
MNHLHPTEHHPDDPIPITPSDRKSSLKVVGELAKLLSTAGSTNFQLYSGFRDGRGTWETLFWWKEGEVSLEKQRRIWEVIRTFVCEPTEDGFTREEEMAGLKYYQGVTASVWGWEHLVKMRVVDGRPSLHLLDGGREVEMGRGNRITTVYDIVMVLEEVGRGVS